MRKLLGVLAVGGLALMLGASAQAASFAFNGTLATTVGAFPPIATTGSGTGTSAGMGGAATIPSGIFAINVGAVISPAVSGLGGFALCKGGIAQGTALTIPSFTGACGAGNQATNAALNWTGTSGTGGLAGSSYLTNTAFSTVGEIPLNVVGNGGSSTGSLLLGLINFTIQGNPWTLAAITSTGVLNGATTVLTATGFDNRNPGGGVLQLVSPTLVTLAGAAAGTIPSIAVLTLDFVPEPGTLLMLGSGVAGLAILGRRRMS